VGTVIRLPVLGVALALAVPAVGGDNPGKDKLFKVSYQAALKKAKGANKLVMIDFYADWCGPCKQLDAKTFSNAKVRRFLQDRTIPVRVNVDDNRRLAGKYKIRAIPCMVFVDAEGTEVGRILGFEPPDGFLKKAGKIVR
jgi:thiol:disulfide interchange protein DsbD